jgi:hypothetical protein
MLLFDDVNQPGPGCAPRGKESSQGADNRRIQERPEKDAGRDPKIE